MGDGYSDEKPTYFANGICSLISHPPKNNKLVDMSYTEMVRKAVLQGEFLFHEKNHGSKIIYYHDFNDDRLHKAFARDATSLEMFKKHLQVIKDNGFNVVEKITQPERQVVIGLDDGWAGVLDVKDFLYENNIFPTISIAPCLLNMAGYISDRDVKMLRKEGCRIISHTWTHQSITLYNNYEGALKRELSDSKHYLEDLLSEEVDCICYPQGRFSKTTYEKSVEYGYKEIWSCIDGNFKDEVFPMVKRRNLAQSIDENELKWTLLGPNKIKAKRHMKMLYTNV